MEADPEAIDQLALITQRLRRVDDSLGHAAHRGDKAFLGRDVGVEENALQAILNAADGTPRMINKFCNASLLIGESHKAATINADIVMQAINDTEL